MNKSAPDALPQLRRHAHLHPDDGACLMEFVSLLAGQPWSDSPSCTHPLLASLARIVNDALPDNRRTELLPLASELTNRNNADPRTTTDGLAACLTNALQQHPRSPRLQRALRRTRRRAARLERSAARHRESWPTVPQRWLDRLFQRSAATHRLTAAVHAIKCGANSEDELIKLLHVAVHACQPKHIQSRVKAAV